MSPIPCFWFDGSAEEAAAFYVSLFANSSVDRVLRYPDGAPFPVPYSAGSVMLVEFTLQGRPYQALNGGPQFPVTEASSLVVETADQAETDRIWAALTAGGGAEQASGWCKDRFGLSWQIVPRRISQLQFSGRPDQVSAMYAAMMPMKKLDIAKLEAVFNAA